MQKNECHTIIILQECYGLLQKMDIAIAQEEMNKVDTLRYSFQKLLRQAVCTVYQDEIYKNYLKM